ncbi:MAG: Wzz/FepE/Etk N-terminal domain-containing protein [Verrucomicrobiales bacterium]
MSANPEPQNTSTPDSAFRWAEVDLHDVVFLVRRHLPLLILAPLSFAALAFAATRLAAPVYTSTAEVYIRPNFDRNMQIDQEFAKLEDADSLRSIERAMVSDTVVLDMIERLELRDDAGYLGEEIPPEESPLTDDGLLKKVRDRYEAKLLPNTRSIELTVRDYSAERSQRIADALLREFIDHLGKERDAKKDELRVTLTAQAEDALRRSLESEKKLGDFRSQNPDLIVEQDSSIFQERLTQYSSALNEATSEQSRLEGMKAAVSEFDPEKDPYRIFQALENRNSEYLSDLLAMHATARTEMASAEQEYTESHPNYQRTASRLAQIESTLRDYAEEMKEGLEHEHRAAIRKVEKLNESMAGLQDEFVRFKRKSAEFRGFKEEIDRHWNTYSKLQEKITELDLALETDLEFVTTMSKPIVPDKKSHPVTLLWTGAGGILGLMLVGGSLLWRYRDGLPVTNEAQPGKRFDAPVLACVKSSPEGDFPTRDLLNLVIGFGKRRTLQVTGASGSGQGSRLPTAIGELFARRGQRTLLIRLRMNEANPGEDLSESRTPGLSLADVSAERLLQTSQFRFGLERSLESFDRVVVDTTSIEPWQASVAVSAEVDATLVVVRKGWGSRALYRRFVERCRAAGADAFFSVLVEGREPRPKKAKRKTASTTGFRSTHLARFFGVRATSRP